MPQISKQRVSINHSDIKKWFDIVVKYNSKQKFYIELPEEFKEIIGHFTSEERSNLYISSVSRSRKSYLEPFEEMFLLTSETEVGCISLFKETAKVLLGRTITKRNVILIKYDPHDIVHQYKYEYNEEHPQIGLQFGLTYAVESVSGNKTVYSVYKPDPFESSGVIRHELSFYNPEPIVIPDTPENREVLEKVYKGLQSVRDTLKELTKNSETILNAIQSNQNLLSLK